MQPVPQNQRSRSDSMKYIKLSKISKFISDAKKWILNRLPIYNNITFVNRLPLEDMGRYETTLYIGQFYQNSNIQQANTIILTDCYFEDILTNDEIKFDDDVLEARYYAFFGVHQDFHWLYFYKANVFIAFHKDKIMFTLNNSSSYEDAYNLALSAKNPNRSVYVLYRKNLNILIERSQRIIQWICTNQDFKNTLAPEPNSYWDEFFNKPLDLSRFKNTTFEIINPKIHLPKEQPIGNKIILYPFFHYFRKSKAYSNYNYSEYNQCYINNLERYLKDYCYHIYQEHNTTLSDYLKYIDFLIKEEDVADINTTLLINFYKAKSNFEKELNTLGNIIVPSPNSYHLFGFMDLSYFKSYQKIWATYDPYINNSAKYFVDVRAYSGEDLETSNIKIIDKAVKRTDNYINYLNNFIDKTKGDIDLDNPNSKFIEYCHLLTLLNKDLEKVRLHQEYLNDFKYQLFPPDDVVI